MDILSIQHGIIVHQVNCQRVMGAGIALQIRKKWPIVYQRYRAYRWKLGQIQLVKVADHVYVCNLAGQDRYGRDKQYTDYGALETGLTKLNIIANSYNLPIFIPEGMGCRNAGGDWKVVWQIISKTLTTCTFRIVSKPIT